MNHDQMITVSGLVKSHGNHMVLNGVNFGVRRGEVATIIGPSGGGKSTLLRCINALEPFERGTVRVDEIELQPDATMRSSDASLLRLRRMVGMVFQQFNLFPHLSVLDNVTIGPRRALGWPKDKANDLAQQLLNRVGLKDKTLSRTDQLSGGQQQRVAIARALAVQPKAILFDEPTSALDPRMSAEVMAVIADLAKDGLTMVVVTHGMHFARRVANTVHVMADGQIAESGTPDCVFENAASAITRAFLHEVAERE